MVGEILLLEYPYSNVSGSKRRPGLVLVDIGDDDIVAAPVTTHSPRDEFDVELIDWAAAGLIRPSVVRPHKLSVIEKRLIYRRFGRLSEFDLSRVQDSLRRLSVGS